MPRLSPFLLASAALFCALPGQAKMPWVKEAQKLGFKDIKSCQSCHAVALPKPADKGEPLNELGTFLKTTKTAKKAASVDLNWIKDFKPKK